MSVARMFKIPDGDGNLVSFPIQDQENRRSRRDITSDLANLSAAVTERNLTKYGYSIGDYFTGPSGYEYTLGDQDTFSGIGKYNEKTYAVIHEPHLSIVVNTKQKVQWNTTNVTDTGYVGSNLHSYLVNTVLPNVKNDFATLFGNWVNHLISHSKLYRTNNNKWGWGWSNDQYISALTSVQFHGSPICDMDGTDTGEGNKPLEVFQKFFYPEILGNQNNWLRSVSAAGYPCNAATNGAAAGDNGASDSYWAVGLIIFK